VKRGEIAALQDALAVEEPLEIQLVYGATDDRKVKSISITMRTPGNNDELAAGFLMTEGVVRDTTHVTSIGTPSTARKVLRKRAGARQVPLPAGLRSQVIRVELSHEVEVSMSTIERNFYTTSSCGVCGKASLLALRTLCPLLHDALKHSFYASSTASTSADGFQGNRWAACCVSLHGGRGTALSTGRCWAAQCRR
jgi:FdhD protein